MNMKRMMAGFAACLILFTGTFVGEVYAETESSNTVQRTTDGVDYEKYLQLIGTKPEATKDILITGDSFSQVTGDGVEKVAEYNGQTGVVCWNRAGATIAYNFKVEEEGYYILKLQYCPIVTNGADIRFRLLIDDQVPFEGADEYVFPLIWKDKTAIEEDWDGNHIRPSQVEAPRFIERNFVNTEAAYDEPFQFYFSAGEHKLSLTCSAGSVAVSSVKLTSQTKVSSYKQVAAQYAANGYKAIAADAEPIKVQAEEATEKSDVALYPASYQNDPGVEPADPVKMRLNTIGGTNWGENGQWIRWTVDVPQTGLYALQFKALQNFAVGRSVSRTLYIDGKIPFEEAKNIAFDYESNWYIKVLGDDEPQLLYLTQGSHEICLEVTLGDMGPIVRSLESILLELNSIYRRIIMVTGVEPDPSRDYSLQSEIPDLMDRFMKVSAALQENISSFETLFGNSGLEISTIVAIQTQLDEFVKRPRDIPSRLSSYKDNVSSLGSILFDLRAQPLMLDYIVLSSPESELPKATAPFWDRFVFGLKAFIMSFASDYSVASDAENGSALNVWISAESGTGRDQADVLKRLVDNGFTRQYGKSVQISLVSTGSSLIQATLADKGPDVALMLTSDTPVNLAMRGALVDLSQFPEYETIKERFYPEALVPFEYNGGVYALPETQDYQMLFYRKDVLEEMGLSVPKTWDEFYTVMSVLQKSHMEVGVAEATNMFETLLYQHGESLYNDERSATNLKSTASINAFKQWTNLYTEYGLQRTFDFYSRFRTGEMPLAIQSVSMYSTLVVSAPELTGLWAMAPLPGVENEDGSINHVGVANGRSCFIIKSAKDQQAAFDFLRWWTSDDVQRDFGVEIEAILGPSGRYYTANLGAFSQLPWDQETAAVLTEQWSNTIATPQVPGNYYVTRCITNAFRQVVDHAKNPREQLFKYDNEINLEIARKRQEFGLD